MKDTQIRKEQIKLLLLPGDIILYIGNPKDSTKPLPQSKKQTKKPLPPKPLELITNAVKLQDTKSTHNNKKSFLYTNNKQKEKLRQIIVFIIIAKRIKYIGIILTNEVKDLYTENYKMLGKEMEEDTNKWKDTPCSPIRKINIVKMSILPKTTFRFHAIPSKVPILKFVWNHKRC